MLAASHGDPRRRATIVVSCSFPAGRQCRRQSQPTEKCADRANYSVKQLPIGSLVLPRDDRSSWLCSEVTFRNTLPRGSSSFLAAGIYIRRTYTPRGIYQREREEIPLYENDPRRGTEIGKHESRRKQAADRRNFIRGSSGDVRSDRMYYTLPNLSPTRQKCL